MDVVLELFPEPIALLDRDLNLCERNAAWRRALPTEAQGELPSSLRMAVVSVLEGRLARAEVVVAAQGAAAPSHRCTVILVPGTETRALVHARPLGEGEDEARHRAIAEENEVLRAVIDAMPSLLFLKDRRGRYVMVNKAYADLYETTVEEILQRNQIDVHEGEEGEGYLRVDAEVIRTGREKTLVDRFTHRSGEVHHMQTTKRPIQRRSGEVQVLGFCIDITERYRAEQARDEAVRELSAAVEQAKREAEEKAALAAELDRRLAVIQTQNLEIMTLSAPILEMGASAIGVPLVGELDAQRTAALTERLLRTITDHQVQHVILDLTGIETVDTSTAGRLIGIVRTIGLLGAQAVITGIRPAVAQTLVTLGADLSGVVTQATPRAALRALERQRH
ncbi:PAS domain-containing protein [Chondromyces crocatus]|uniref:Anti-anti-sigma factor n=1 Tax=Chondromyces crocatus TaxID=52 RepID=A0A0K1ED69_CHOCO|nr:PAS domain-containing protein [Chondromyces crocatus]AKT38820.1 uncharacterized protein CMC5_029660 [Chondromyces crocatus]